MSIYYYGKLIGTYDLDQKQSEPVLVGDIIKSRDDYQTYTKLDSHETSSASGLASRDEMRTLSDRKVLESTFLEEKATDRSGDKAGLAGILCESSNKPRFVIRHYQDA